MNQTEFLDEEYEVLVTGLNEDGDDIPHDGRRFCVVDDCPCHEDPDLIAETMAEYQAGLLSAEDATRMVKGWTF